jgi:hypothetical protein
VVAVIEEREDARGASCIEFKVERSPTEPGRVLGRWRLVHGTSNLVDEGRDDATAASEFRLALDCADQHGIPYVWVNDPDGLFPPWERR